MSFCTAVNCMDGRVQIPVIRFLKERFVVDYVDVVSEPGPNRILAEQDDPRAVESILNRVAISVEHHGSVGIAVVGHHDCAGNPATPSEQEGHTRAAVDFIRTKYGGLPVIGLWVDDAWKVTQVAR